MEAWVRRVALVITVAFVILVVIPLTAEKFSATKQWKTLFANFQLVDENGRAHVGFMSMGRILVLDLQNLQYGYETDGSVDLDGWRRKISRGPFEPEYGKDGFHWSDDGFLWAGPTYLGKGKRFFREGETYGFSVPLDNHSQAIIPGAPLDAKGANLSLIGKFPVYEIRYEDEYFALGLEYRAAANGWYRWNEGMPFRTGDFGWGSMSELPCTVTGEITQKKAQRSFRVQGTGLIEDATGQPWSWFDWGDHNWFVCAFPNGWSVGLWKATDDWQWGYSINPQEAWIYDPGKEKYYTAKKLELLDGELVKDGINDQKYMKRFRWRGVTAEGVLEMQGTGVCYKPIKRGVPLTPFTFKESYTYAHFDGRFIRNDGSTVELKNGLGLAEHFTALFPDMYWRCPVLLYLLILSWGGVAIMRRRRNQGPVWGVLLAMGFCLALVSLLWGYWS